MTKSAPVLLIAVRWTEGGGGAYKNGGKKMKAIVAKDNRT